MKSNFELVRDFHFAFNKKQDPSFPTVPDVDTAILRGNLIKEEVIETFDEMGVYFDNNLDIRYNVVKNNVNLVNIAKELADILYVVYGTAAAYGIPIDDVFREVHRSNMSKLGDDGKPVYREDGKVLKGPNYTPADISKIIKV